ncbi:nucleotide disphospho-sugar-binding domain-containing protein [uncultured Algibacter sp.]|uniref:glycosyltransferase n=1 Tax=uncultured Algibacter sp. TaxID=298659 RepID=UPI00262949BF|nr:nucleotide disphospho-sugar-binding domain-containing protein [uncultured Algibacter sp.]
MAHIAIIMTGLTGNLHASLEVASRLENEGHTITYLAVRDVKNKVENCGFNYVALPEIVYSLQLKDLNFPLKSSWFNRKIFSLKNKKTILKTSERLLNLNQYKNILEKTAIDFAIIDQELHDLIFVLFALKTPFALSSSWFSNRMGSGLKLPPIRTDMIPRKGLVGNSLNILFNWIKIKLKVKARILVNKLSFKDYRRQALLNYAKTNGFPTKKIVASNLPDLFTYPHIQTLSMTMKEMDFKHKPYKNFKYYGPMVFESRDKNYSKDISKSLVEIFSNKLKENKKLIFCSVSTLVPGDITFLNKLIEAVRIKKEWLLIITLGDKIDKTTFKNLPDHVFLFNWVPQLEVLKNADININHAGINSINECIHYKVPMLIYSGKNFDQNGCAARVHYHGMGIMGDKDNDSPEQISQKISRILNESQFQNKMNDFHKLYQKYRDKKISDILPNSINQKSKL